MKEYKSPNWTDIERSCLVLCCEMEAKGYEPDSIIALLRGGVTPAIIFADYFNVSLNFYTINAKSYDEMGDRGEITIRSSNEEIPHGRILIVDDIWDTGKTMEAVLKDFMGRDITTATIYWREGAFGKPDYFYEPVKNEWVVFPWEKNENRRRMKRRIEISIDTIKTLRDRTGISLRECRTALEECDGDTLLAEGYLKYKGCAINCGSKENKERWVMEMAHKWKQELKRTVYEA